MPALVRIIWDGYFDALSLTSEQAAQLAMAIRKTVKQKERMPTISQLLALVEGFKKIPELHSYVTLASHLSSSGLIMRMVPTKSLGGFYDGPLVEAWKEGMETMV